MGLSGCEGGEGAAAERDWNELIDLAIVQPRLPRASARPTDSAATTAAPKASRPTGPIPATLSQFTLATALAEAAAEKGQVEVSLRAVREVLSGEIGRASCRERV